ncbi:UNVERIFIED_CONTAM: hypothetical protein GTU68_055747 [Idotea baltica]|nr:hypothetical protein [Idotea baltica]
MKVLEEVFRTIIRRKFGTDENCDVIVNTDKGDLEIWRTREIVANGDVEDSHLQIELKEAGKLKEELDLDDDDIEVGEEIYEQIFINDFGRRAVLAARQTLKSKIVEIEKDELYKGYKDRVGEIITGEVYQIWKREILVIDDEGNELSLPKSEMIKRDFFKKSDPIRAIIKDVELRNNNPIIRLSRTHNDFLAKLLELEVPEIFDGLITIKAIARQPGERAKVAVESYDERIDPVGACVGMKGSRIHGIVRELKNENIDIIPYTENTSLFIQRCLTPAKINSMRLNEETRKASVYLDPDEVSKAIGKGGLNIKLASRLTNYQIDVYRDTEDIEEFDDIELQEFADEIDQWVIDALINIGCDTARSVLRLKPEEVIRRADLEDETVADVFKVLSEEFTDESKDVDKQK